MQLGMGIINVMVLIIIGVILAKMISDYQGTQAVFGGLSDLWGKAINGLLGKTS
jgi:hypothetical protein